MTNSEQYNWKEISTVLKNVSSIVINKGELNDYLKNFFVEIGYHKLFEQLILSDNMDHYWRLDFNMIQLLFGNITHLIDEIRRSEIDTEIQNELLDFFDLCAIVSSENESYSKIGITYKFQYVTPRNFQGNPLKLSNKVNSAQLFCELIPFNNFRIANIENISPLYQYFHFIKENQNYVCITLKNNDEQEIKSAINTFSNLNAQLNIKVNQPLEKGTIVGTFRGPKNHVIKIRSIQPPIRKSDEPNYEIY